MDLSDKPVKSCAIKVHLASLIKRKSYVTLVLPESSAGLIIKRMAMKKVGMNEQQIQSTEIFVSVRDSFRAIPNSEEVDGSNLFHVQEHDCPGHYVDLRFCEFHLHWRDSLPQSLENPVNISKFRSRASIEDKLTSAVNKKLSGDQLLTDCNVSAKSTRDRLNQTKDSNSSHSSYSFSANLSQNLARNLLFDGGIESKKKAQNRNSVSLNFQKSLNNKSEVALNRNGSVTSKIGEYNMTSEIKCRPPLSSVKLSTRSTCKNLESSKVEPPVTTADVLNSPSSSYSSSSIELKHNLSTSMPVLNKFKVKEIQNGLCLKNGPNAKDFHKVLRKTSSKTNISDCQSDSLTGSDKFVISRRQLPQVAIPEEAVEEKRYLLSKELERRLIRRASVNASSRSSDRKTLHKTSSLMGWKEKHKFTREDSDDSRSLASQEVAEIMSDAGPMGVVESDYEEPRTSGLDEDEGNYPDHLSQSKKNVFLSLFDSMASDSIDGYSDAECRTSKDSKVKTSLNSSLSSNHSFNSNKNSNNSCLHPSSISNLLEHSVQQDSPLKTILQSNQSNFVLYSQIKQQQPLIIGSKLALFDILSLGNLHLFPVTVPLIEKHDVRGGRTKSMQLPFKVYYDVVRLSSTLGSRNRDFNDMDKTFAALKIKELTINSTSSLPQFHIHTSGGRPTCQVGDLLVEVNNLNVLGFTASEFLEIETSLLSQFKSIHVVVARSLEGS